MYSSVDDIRADIAPFTLESGRCKDDAYVIEYLNQARRLLWSRGDWKGAMDYYEIEVIDGMITLPYDAEVVRKAWIGVRGQFYPEQSWYQKISPILNRRTCCDRGELRDLGDKFASFRDYTVSGKHHPFRILLVNESDVDAGVTLTFNGIGENGNRVSLPVKLKEAWTETSTSEWVNYFRGVSKPATDGRVLVYIFDPNSDIKQLCAIYEPDDINTNYRRYRVAVNCGARPLEVYVKRKYRPLLRASDLVEFPTDALIQACLAITARRAKNAADFSNYVNLAIEHLQRELIEDDERQPFPVQFAPTTRNENL